MKNALFLQSWYSHITDNWYPWLKTELQKKGYITNFPDIPEFRQDQPKLKTIINEISSRKVLNFHSLVLGHSLGCLVAMRLAEQHSFRQMILVSGWDFDDLTEGHIHFWKKKMNHEAIKKHVTNIIVVHSDNDPYITACQAEDMSKRLQAKFVLVPKSGHFLARDGVMKMPEVLEAVE